MFDRRAVCRSRQLSILRSSGTAVVWLTTLAACAPIESFRTDTGRPEQRGSPTAASFYASNFERRPSVAELTELGRALFSDPSLSASGKLTCSSCHDPAHAYGP